LVHGLSGARQRIAIRQPLKEPDTQTFLEGAKSTKHGRVRYAKTARCARQRARPGDSEEKAQIVPVLVLCIHEGSPLQACSDCRQAAAILPATPRVRIAS